MKWLVIENCVTMACMAAIILGGWWIGMGEYSLFGLVLWLNLNRRYPESE